MPPATIRPPKLEPFTLPKSLAQCADLLYLTRQNRLAIQKVVEELEKRESQLKEKIIAELPVSQATGIAGAVARATIVPKTIPRAIDWAEIFKYIKKTDAFDLVQRRLSDGAVNERWEHGVEIPGVERFNTKTVSLNKV
jgi:hypothetical protein